MNAMTLLLLTMIQTMTLNEVIITNFTGSTSLDWRVINDGVMGGLSSSTMTTSGETGVFSGEVSLKNNGGFASVRAMVDMDLTGVKAAKIRVKGDGNIYSLRFRTDRNFDGVSYVANFTTKDGEWSEHIIALDDFKPQFRGRVLQDRPPLAGEDIKQVGILISDKQEGAFRLEIDRIVALK